MDAQTLHVNAKAYRDQMFSAQRMWSVAYHGSTIGAVALGAASTYAALMEWSAVGTGVLTGLTTIVTGVTATGKFGNKWRAARVSRGQVDTLISDIDGANPDYEKLRKRLNKIREAYDGSITEAIALAEEQGQPVKQLAQN